ncbi:MAG: Glucose-1-phosphate adenylyltransferase [Chlamydiia bacterium]|nr:Glucose-1-phosphate adenylyltransferase [Chlamydiia bacterium]
MSEPIIFVLAGGEGTRLSPLTSHRCKPAVPFAGRYRLIDIALSNALKKDFKHIYAVTQYLSSSLNDYIKKAYGESVSVLTGKESQYEGTADSIRKNLDLLKKTKADHVIILSGDQLYSMDLDEMLMDAQEKDCDLLIATLPIDEEEATRMGVMKIDDKKEIIDFKEKPQEESLLQRFSLSRNQSSKIHEINERIFLGSMGIYIFKKEALIALLEEDKGIDFGMHIIPRQLSKKNTYAYIFDGYWEDIGTIKSYYKANLKLLESSASLNIFNKEKALHTDASTLPPAMIENCLIDKSVITDGCIIKAKQISHSLIGLNTSIGEGSILTGVLSLGTISKDGMSYIGQNCFLEKVIVDENATIESGADLSLHGTPLPDTDLGPVMIKDGIIIVKQGATVPKNFSIVENKQRLSA